MNRVSAGASMATLSLMLFASLFACESYDAPDVDIDPHASFPIDVGVHADVGCDLCHVQAARVYQGLPADADGDWVREPNGFACGACHPFSTGSRDQLAGTFCPEDSELPWCQYLQTSGHSQFLQADLISGELSVGCESCHDPVAHGGWCRQAECVDAPAHDPLLTAEGMVFPLVGGHADVACSECHTNGTNQGLDGYGEQCSNCHLRTDEPSVAAPVGPDHYATPVAPLDPANTERARDCKACHQSVDINGDVTWPTSWSDNVLHNFVVSHNVAEWPSTGPVPTNPAAWANQCFFCHNQNDNPANLLPTTPPPADAVYGDFVTSSLFPRRGCTNGCHSDLPQQIPAHSTELSCTTSNCHPIGRRNSILLPGEPLEEPL